MSKGVLYFLLIIIAVAAIAAVVLNVWVPSAMKPAARIPRSLEQEIANPELKAAAGLPAAAATAPKAPMPSGTVLAAGVDAAPPDPRPEPPRVTSVQGSWGRNPFLTLEEIDFLRNPRKYDMEPEPPKIRLSIIVSDTATGRRKATIGNHDVFVGDMVGIEKVVQINEFSMVLQRENGKTREIQLHELVVPLSARGRRE